jgi:hypothetical protein
MRSSWPQLLISKRPVKKNLRTIIDIRDAYGQRIMAFASRVQGQASFLGIICLALLPSALVDREYRKRALPESSRLLFPVARTLEQARL